MSITKRTFIYFTSGVAAFGFGSVLGFAVLLATVYVSLRKADY